MSKKYPQGVKNCNTQNTPMFIKFILKYYEKYNVLYPTSIMPVLRSEF